MPIRPELLLAHNFPEVGQSYAKRDTILYALGVGLGADPNNASDLAFLLEHRLLALPTFAVTLGTPGMWIRDPRFGVNYAKLVHYEQAATFPFPLPAEGEVVARARAQSVYDRGDDRGALIIVEREIRDAAQDRVYCVLKQTLLLRGDGGFGGAPPPLQPSIVPDRAPDTATTFDTDRRAALIYRLSGDWNPLHADPEAARLGGFDRPILHGLASYAIAGIAVARALDRSPSGIKSLRCRFAGVVFPGDTLSFRIWRQDAGAAFQAYVGERRALDQGFVSFGDAT